MAGAPKRRARITAHGSTPGAHEHQGSGPGLVHHDQLLRAPLCRNDVNAASTP